MRNGKDAKKNDLKNVVKSKNGFLNHVKKVISNDKPHIIKPLWTEIERGDDPDSQINDAIARLHVERTHEIRKQVEQHGYNFNCDDDYNDFLDECYLDVRDKLHILFAPDWKTLTGWFSTVEIEKTEKKIRITIGTHRPYLY